MASVFQIKRYAKFSLGVLAAALLGGFLTHSISLVQHLERRTEDIRIAGFSQGLPQDSELAVVAINEETLQKFSYRSPVDREFLANLLKNIEKKGAKAIYLDVLIDQPTEPSKDKLLFDTIRAIKTPLVIGYTNSKDVLNKEQLEFLNQFVEPSQRGLVNLATDPFDGTVRWINRADDSKDSVSSVPYKVLASIDHSKDTNQITESNKNLETIAWRRSNKSNVSPFAIYPAHGVFYMPKEWFAGKVVLVGAILSITDRHRTPFAVFHDNSMGMMSGVEIFAHQISQLIHGVHIEETSQAQLVLVLLGFSLMGGLLGMWRKSMTLTILLTLGIVSGYWVIGLLGFEHGLPLYPLIAPTLGFLIALFLVEFLLGKEDRERRAFIQSAFSRYLAPSVVQQLVDHPDSLSIAGKKRTLSFIFTDIESFTTLSETIDPEILSNLLNEYLEGMCAQIQKHHGIVDKFIGDSVMAFFNAPMDQPDHADRALECALALDAFSQDFRVKVAVQGIKMGVTRIGIHSGDAVVGNFGSMSRMEFTALGDTVNAASRTEGVNKYFGTRICVTQETLSHVTRTKVKARPIGHVYLKGKNKPIDLFEPVTEVYAMSAAYAEYMNAFNVLDTGNDGAFVLFEQLKKNYPDDALISFHYKRLTLGKSDASIVMQDK
jgi:class 3 adenylate cyclase/CHASE2 domain-containing sensor protein